MQACLEGSIRLMTVPLANDAFTISLVNSSYYPSMPLNYA